MKAFQKKLVAITAVAGLAVLGAACADDDTEVESPGVEEPAGDTTVNEGDTTVEEGDTELEVDPTVTETETTG